VLLENLQLSMKVDATSKVWTLAEIEKRLEQVVRISI
jgi:hypothetical protein